MSVLSDMTKRAVARYELDTLLVKEPQDKARQATLRSRIAALTAKISKAKSRKAPHKKGSPNPTKSKVRKGSKVVKGGQTTSTRAMKPWQRAIQAAKSKLPSSKPTACVRCRAIRNYGQPNESVQFSFSDSGSICRPVNLRQGDSITINLPSISQPRDQYGQYGDNRFFTWFSLDDSQIRLGNPLFGDNGPFFTFHWTPPASVPSGCRVVPWVGVDNQTYYCVTNLPKTYTVDRAFHTMCIGVDAGLGRSPSVDFNIAVRRKIPNLTSAGTRIDGSSSNADGSRGRVGFGYRVGDAPVPGNIAEVKCGLFYARGGSIVDLVGTPIHAIPISAEANYHGSFDGPNPHPWWLTFVQMAGNVPPKEATHIVSAVDWEYRLEETNENDNCFGEPLPEWPRKFEWKDVPRSISVPVTVWGSSGRTVKPIILRVRLQEEIWHSWRNARDCFHLRVRLESRRTGKDAGRTGWLYTRHEAGMLSAKKVLIPKGRKPDPDMPHPVPPLDEGKNPWSGKQTDPYLRIGVNELGKSEEDGVLRFLYLPPILLGTDRLVVELWKDAVPHPLGMIDVEIEACAKYEVKFGKTPASVPASYLVRSGLPKDRQPERRAQPINVKVTATLNDRPISDRLQLRLRIVPMLEDVPPDSVAPGTEVPMRQVKDPDVLRGWIYSEKNGQKLRKGLKRRKLIIKLDRKERVPALQEPMPRARTVGVTNSILEFHEFRPTKSGTFVMTYLAPERGGADRLIAELFDPRDPKAILASASHEITLVRQRIVVALVPGIMGSRLRVPAAKWDIDAGSLSHWATVSAADQATQLGIQTPGTIENLDGTPPGGRAHLQKGSVMQDGGVLLSSLLAGDFYATGMSDLITRSVRGPFALPVYGVGYDWRQSNEDSAGWIGERIRQAMSQEGATRLILITHSMGGLATRRYLQRTPDNLRQNVLAAVHIFQPVDGAPIMYQRLFIGVTDSATTGYLLGNTGPKFRTVASSMQGPFDLLPTEGYNHQAGWIQAEERTPVGRSIWSVYLDPETPTPPGILGMQGAEGAPDPPIRVRTDSAKAFHEQLDGGTRFQLAGRTWSIIGGGVTTCVGVRFETMANEFGERWRSWGTHPVEGDGDGTVPLVSAAALFPDQTTNGPMAEPSESVRQFTVQRITHDQALSGDTMNTLRRILNYVLFGVAEPSYMDGTDGSR